MEYSPKSQNSDFARREPASSDEFKALFGTLRNESKLGSMQPTLMVTALPTLMARGVLTKVVTQPKEIEKILKGKIFRVKGKWKLEDLRSKKPIWPSSKIEPKIENGILTFHGQQLELPFDPPINLELQLPNEISHSKEGTLILAETAYFSKAISRGKRQAATGFMVVAADPLREEIVGISKKNLPMIQEEIESEARRTENVLRVTIDGIEFVRGFSGKEPVWMFHKEKHLDAFIQHWNHLGLVKREGKKLFDFIRSLKPFDEALKEVEYSISVRSFMSLFKVWNHKEFKEAVKTLKKEIEDQFEENEDEKIINGIHYFKRRLERSNEVMITFNKSDLMKFATQYKDRGFDLKGTKSVRHKRSGTVLERSSLMTMAITENPLFYQALMLIGILNLAGIDWNPGWALGGLSAIGNILAQYGSSNPAKKDPIEIALIDGVLQLGDDKWLMTEEPKYKNSTVHVYIEEGIDEEGEAVQYPLLIDFIGVKGAKPTPLKMCEVRDTQGQLVHVYNHLQTIDQKLLTYLAKLYGDLTLHYDVLDHDGKFSATKESSLPIFRHKKNKEVEVHLNSKGRVKMIWLTEQKKMTDHSVRTLTRLESAFGFTRTLFPQELEFVDSFSKKLTMATGEKISESRASIIASTLIKLQKNSLNLLVEVGLLTKEDVLSLDHLNSLDHMDFEEAEAFDNFANRILQLVQTYEKNELTVWQIDRLLSTKLIPWETLKKWQEKYNLNENLDLVLDALPHPDVEAYLKQVQDHPSLSKRKIWDTFQDYPRSDIKAQNRIALVTSILAKSGIAHGMQLNQFLSSLIGKRILYIGLEKLGIEEAPKYSVADELNLKGMRAEGISPFAGINGNSNDLYTKGEILDIPKDSNQYDLIVAEPFFDEYFDVPSMKNIGYENPADYYVKAADEIMRVLKDDGKFLVMMRYPWRASEFKKILGDRGFKVELLSPLGGLPVLEISKIKLDEKKEDILRHSMKKILDSYDMNFVTLELDNITHLVEKIPIEKHNYYETYVVPAENHYKKIMMAHERAMGNEMLNEIIASFNSAFGSIPEEIINQNIEHLVRYLDELNDDSSKAVLAYYQIVSQKKFRDRSFVDVDPITLIKKEEGIWNEILRDQISEFHRLLVDQNTMPEQIEEKAKTILSLKYLEEHKHSKLIKDHYESLIRRVISRISLSSHALMDYLGIIAAVVPTYLDDILSTEPETPYSELERAIKSSLEKFRSLIQKDWENLSTKEIIKVFKELINVIGDTEDPKSNINFLRGKPTGIERVKEERDTIKAKLASFIQFILFPYYLAFIPTILRAQIAFLRKQAEKSPKTIYVIWQEFDRRVSYIGDKKQEHNTIRNRFSDWWDGLVIERVDEITIANENKPDEKIKVPVKKEFAYKGNRVKRFIRTCYKNEVKEAKISNPIGLQRVLGEILKNCGEKNAKEDESWKTFVNITFNRIKLKGQSTIEITIEDNGMGIPEEMLKVDPVTRKQMIWNRGGTTGGKGRGIGMSEAYRLIQDAGGTIVADNKSRLRPAKKGDRGGARFIIRLPEIIPEKKNSQKNLLKKTANLLTFALQVPLFMVMGIPIGGRQSGSFVFGQPIPDWKIALQKGVDAFRLRDWPSAIKWHLEALKLHPSKEVEGAIWTHLAEAYMHNQKYRASLDAIHQAEKRRYDQQAYLKYLAGAVYFDWAMEAQEIKDASAFLKRVRLSEESFTKALEIHEALILRDSNTKFGLDSIQIEESVHSIAKINIFAGDLEDLKRVETLLLKKYPVKLGDNSRLGVLIGLSAAYLNVHLPDRAVEIIKIILQTNDKKVLKTVIEKLQVENDYAKHIYSLLQQIASGKMEDGITLLARRNSIEILMGLGFMESREGLSLNQLKALLRSLRNDLQERVRNEFPNLRIREYLSLSNALFRQGWEWTQIEDLIRVIKIRNISSETQIRKITEEINKGKGAYQIYPFLQMEKILEESLQLTDADTLYAKIKDMDSAIEKLKIDDKETKLELRDTYINAATAYLSLVRRVKRKFMIDEAFQVYYNFIYGLGNEDLKSIDPVILYQQDQWEHVLESARNQLKDLLRTRQANVKNAVDAYQSLLALHQIGKTIESGKLTTEISKDLSKNIKDYRELDIVYEVAGSAYGFLKYVLPNQILDLDTFEPLVQSLQDYVELVNEGGWKTSTEKIIVTFQNLIDQIQDHLPSLLKRMGTDNLNSALTKDEINLSQFISAESGLKLLPKILKHRISFLVLSLATLFFLTPATFAESLFFKSIAQANAQSYRELTLTQQQELSSISTFRSMPSDKSKSKEPIENQIMGIATLLGDRVNIKGYQVKEENIRFILNHGDLNSSIFEIKDFLEEIKIKSSQNEKDEKRKDQIIIVTELESSKKEIENFLLNEGVSIEEFQSYIQILVQPKEKGKFNIIKLIKEHNLADGYSLRVLNKNGLWSFEGLMNQIWKEAFQENRIIFIEKSLFKIKVVGYSQ